MDVVETRKLSQVYGDGEARVVALRGVSLTIQAGTFVAVVGQSGSGKSTLMQLIGGLDRPTSGEVLIEGRGLSGLSDDELTAVRRRKIGFVFQAFNLIPVLSALENVALPLILDGVGRGEAERRAADWLRALDLSNRLDHRPHQLSGGQQQRVAVARALVSEPALVLADEPTGNLDSRAAAAMAELLRRIAGEWGRTVLMVTHDPEMAAAAGRVITLADGSVVSDQPAPARERADVMEVVR